MSIPRSIGSGYMRSVKICYMKVLNSAQTGIQILKRIKKRPKMPLRPLSHPFRRLNKSPLLKQRLLERYNYLARAFWRLFIKLRKDPHVISANLLQIRRLILRIQGSIATTLPYKVLKLIAFPNILQLCTFLQKNFE